MNRNFAAMNAQQAPPSRHADGSVVAQVASMTAQFTAGMSESSRKPVRTVRQLAVRSPKSNVMKDRRLRLGGGEVLVGETRKGLASATVIGPPRAPHGHCTSS